MPADGTLQVGTQVNLGNLRAGMAEAQAAVKQASESMAEAQAQFGRAAAQGNAQAAAALKAYQAELNAATVNLAAFSTKTEAATVSTRGLTATAALAGREIGGGLGGALARTAAATGLLGTSLSSIMPVIIGIGAIDVFGHMIPQAIELYKDFVSLDGIEQKFLDDVRELQKQDFVKVSSIETAVARLKEADAATTNLREFAESQGAWSQILSGNVAGGVSLLAAQHAAGQGALVTQKQSNELDMRKLDLQHQINLQQIETAHAADGGLIGEQRINAELQKSLAINKEDAEFSRQRDRLAGNIVPSNAGSGDQALKDAQARGEAQAQSMNLARENYTKELAFEKETGSMIDEGARKEIEAYKQKATAAREYLNQVSEYTRGVNRLMAEDDRASLGYHKTYEAGLEKVAEEQSNATQAQIQQSASIAEASIAFQVATGQMTALGASHALAAAHAKEYTERLQELEKELARINADQNLTPTQKATKGQGVQDQMSQLGGQQQITAIKDQTTIAQQAAQPWITAANQVTDAWVGAFNKILIGGTQSWHALRSASEQTTMAIIGDAERWLVKKLETYIEDEIQGIISARAQQKATAMVNSAAAESYAGVAATAAAAAVAGIPIAGPAAAVAAASAMESSLQGFAAIASLDRGTSYIPRDGMAMLHQGEAVLPPPQTQVLMQALTGGGSQSGQAKPGIRDINFQQTFHGAGSGRQGASLRDFAKLLRTANLIT